jgi:hypothetical protein
MTGRFRKRGIRVCVIAFAAWVGTVAFANTASANGGGGKRQAPRDSANTANNAERDRARRCNCGDNRKRNDGGREGNGDRDKARNGGDRDCKGARAKGEAGGRDEGREGRHRRRDQDESPGQQVAPEAGEQESPGQPRQPGQPVQVAPQQPPMPAPAAAAPAPTQVEAVTTAAPASPPSPPTKVLGSQVTRPVGSLARTGVSIVQLLFLAALCLGAGFAGVRRAGRRT